jgi:putative transposase
MARPLRVEFEDAIYHLCGRGNARQAIFHDNRDRARFMELFSESAQSAHTARARSNLITETLNI